MFEADLAQQMLLVQSSKSFCILLLTNETHPNGEEPHFEQKLL